MCSNERSREHRAGPPNLVVTSTAALETAAVGDWLERFADQDYSLTDAVSFAVMTEREITDALALDHHFASAGFRLAPRGAAAEGGANNGP